MNEKLVEKTNQRFYTSFEPRLIDGNEFIDYIAEQTRIAHNKYI